MFKAFVLLLFLHLCTSTHPTHPTTTVDPVEALKATIHEQVERLWQGADSNHDGNFSEQDLEGFLTVYDGNGDHIVTKQEFLHEFKIRNPGLDKVGLGMFLEVDMDQNDVINASDLRRYYQKIDTNGNGRVDHHEFTTYFNQVFTFLFAMEIAGQQQQAPTTAAPTV